MNLVSLSLAYLRQRSLNTALNLALLSLGVATIVFLLLAGTQLERRLSRDAEGVDLVVGAKGSPMQLILSALYQIDVPTGNIPLAEAEKLAAHPLVKSAIPLAMGDSFNGFRIVGTTHDYLTQAGAVLADGALYGRQMEAVLGAKVARETNLKVGDSFVGSHGMGGGGPMGGEHADMPFTVTGILKPTGGVVDRLVLTPVESVWHVHDVHHHDADPKAEATAVPPAPQPAKAEASRKATAKGHDHDHDHDHGKGGGKLGGDDHAHDHDHAEGDDHHHAEDHAHAHVEPREVTALLIRYKSPLAAARLPREINEGSQMQSASPATELTRLLSLLGVGFDAARAFGLLLIGSAALSVFIALYNSTQARRYDLAVMRSLGATRGNLVAQLLTESLIVSLAGTLLGMAIGHAAAELAGRLVPQAQDLGMTGFLFLAEEAYLFLLAVGISVLAALLPAIQVHRADVSSVLSRG
ncbi:MAG TPA: FtsX-like permease family protein [Azospirillaceae bacterium]|nr:FtsX-like permease family protein [Azospirillaceae bacterium]